MDFQQYVVNAPSALRVQPPRKALSLKVNISRHLSTHMKSKLPRAFLHKYLKNTGYQYFLHEKASRIRFSPKIVKVLKKHTAPEIIILKNVTNDGCRAVHTLSTREKEFFRNDKPILGTLLFYDQNDGYAHQIGYMLKKYEDHVDCIMFDTHDSYNGHAWTHALIKMLTYLCKKPTVLYKKNLGEKDMQLKDKNYGKGFGLCFQWSLFVLKYVSQLDPSCTTDYAISYVNKLYKRIFSNLEHDGIHMMIGEIYGS